MGNESSCAALTVSSQTQPSQDQWYKDRPKTRIFLANSTGCA
jgi:hypothetical protein